MTSEQIEDIEEFVVKMASGVALVYPPAAPIVAAFKLFVEAANAAGIVPHEASAEQLAAIGAGVAAAKSSAVTTDRARGKR